jgi:lipase maturation factor 1
LVLTLESAADPFRSVNSYGLFAVMTPSRPEIVVEGSNDGIRWKTYEFAWKAGDPSRRPAFVAPHQPRLDWQMWFAALGTCERNPWLVRFVDRLLEGSPPVLGLLAVDPFPDAPPRMIRTTMYDYRFTKLGEPDVKNEWWRRRELGAYCPVLGSP